MPLGRQEETQRAIVQSPSSSISPSLRLNNDKLDDNEHLQPTNMSSNNETKNNKENFSLLIRLKVRSYFLLKN
jgi:hypothetical protein